MQTFDDVTVLDLSHHIVGPYATKLLADYGADVIKIEPPGGDIARRLPPFQGGEEHPEKSGLFFYLNTNKRSVVLDLRTQEARQHLARLAERADLIVENFAPGTLSRLLGEDAWGFFQRIMPSASLVSVTNFGQDGPYRDYKASELVMYGYGGEMYSMGLTDREPVKMAGTAALFESASAVATAAAGALFASRRFGLGQHIDISIAETHLGGVDRRHAAAIAYQFSGRRTVRAAGAGAGMPSGIYQCLDGYVDFTNAGLYPDRVIDMIGQEWPRDPRYLDPMARMNPELVDEWNAQFIVWCLERTKRQIWAEARRARIMCGPLFSMEDLFTDEHFRGRGFWHTVDHPLMGRFEIPGRPFIMQKGGWELRRPAPLLGQHTAEVLKEQGARTVRTTATGTPATHHEMVTPSRASRPTPPSNMPLSGYRVLDLCVVWAGPFATMLLGDLGAEVIKPENPFVFQPMTRGAVARPPAAMLAMANAWGGGYPRNEPGVHPWNHSPTFVSLYRNKKSFTVDLRRKEGLEILARLVAKSDIVYENNATGTMEKLGITYDWLRSVKPDIIFMRVPAYGSSGPYYNARALGVHLEGVMGHSLLRGYDDADPSANTAIFSGDYLAGTQGAFAAMAALWQRERTGEGQLVEIAQAENAAAMFTQALMDYSLNRRTQTTIGNRDVFGQAPCGVYPCLSPGTAQTSDDRWVTIHVQSDAEWQSLRNVMGDPPWAADPAYATNAGRSASYQAIDAGIAAWTKTLDDYEVTRRCQAAGVAAMPVLEASRIFSDPQVLSRHWLLHQHQVEAGAYEYPGPLWRFSRTPVVSYQPPVMFGEHNDYVYREVLQCSEEEIRLLSEAGHIATEYDPSVR